MRKFTDAVLRFFFASTGGSHLRRNLRGVYLGAFLGLIIAIVFGLILYTLNRQQRL